MLAAYLHSLREAVNRRMALVLIGMAILMAVILALLIKVKPLPNGTSMVFLGQHMMGPPGLGVPAILTQEVEITGGLWIFLAIFASTPLLVSFLEKGWVELTLTKGVPRWKVLLGCYGSGVTLYAMTLGVAMLPAAMWLCMKTGVGIQPFLVAIAFETFGFAALMAIVALAALSQTGPALPITLAIVADLFSPALANRKIGLFALITSGWGQGTINWVYRILPKNYEIVDSSRNYIQFHTIPPAWPFWSTGIFTVATLGLAIWLLHRKSL